MHFKKFVVQLKRVFTNETHASMNIERLMSRWWIHEQKNTHRKQTESKVELMLLTLDGDRSSQPFHSTFIVLYKGFDLRKFILSTSSHQAKTQEGNEWLYLLKGK